VGAIRGVSLYLAIDAYGYINRVSFASSTISSLLYTSIYYGGASLFISLLLRKNRQFHSEFETAAFYRLQRELDCTSSSIDSNYEATMLRISAAISSEVSTSSSMDQDQIKRICDEIRFQIQNVLRPLSHRLWIDSFGEIRIGSPKEILKDAIIDLRFSKSFILGYQFFVGIFGIGIVLGFFNGIVKSLIATTVSLTLFAIFDRYRLNREVQTLKSSILLLLLVATVPGFTSELISYLIDLPFDFLASAIIGPGLPAILVVAAVYGLITRDKDFALSAARSIRLSESNNFGIDSHSIESRELSEYLHNTLQSELLRISKHLELSNDSQETARHIEQVNRALSRSRSEVAVFRTQGIERLTSICKSWEGIADISLEIDQIEGIDPSKLASAASIVEEMISNSIRYAEASVIFIQFQGRIPFIEISLTHNGSKVVTQGEGLGSLSLSTRAVEPLVFIENLKGITLRLTV
jgi:signal transduction histidine kinase